LVEPITNSAEIKLGKDIKISAGPIGHSITIDLRREHKETTPCYGYSHTSGIFSGFPLEGTITFPSPEVNNKFYGKNISSKGILMEVFFGKIGINLFRFMIFLLKSKNDLSEAGKMSGK